MPSPRDELAELRRLAELEKKAAGLPMQAETVSEGGFEQFANRIDQGAQAMQQRFDEAGPEYSQPFHNGFAHAAGGRRTNGQRVLDDIAKVPGELPQIIGGGLRDAAQGVTSLGNSADNAAADKLGYWPAITAGNGRDGIQPSDFIPRIVNKGEGSNRNNALSLPEVERPESVTGNLGRGAVQFGTGYTGAARALPNVVSKLPSIPRAIATGGVGEFFAFEGNQGRLSDIVSEDYDGAGSGVVNALRTGEDDSELTGRLKNVVEGGILGGTIDTAFSGARGLVRKANGGDFIQPRSGSVGDVLEGVLDVPGARRGDYRVIQRLLERSGVPRDRVTAGMQRVRDAVESGVDSSLLPTRLKDVLVDEFQDFHGVANAIETQLQGAATRSGSSSAATVRQVIDADNVAAGEGVGSTLRTNLGSGRRSTEERLGKNELQRIGREGYDPVLQNAQAVNASAPTAARLKETLREEPLTRPTLRRQAQLAGLSVDDYIDQRPFEAAHWVQSKLGAAGRGSTGREGIELSTARQNILDDLEEGAPGYNAVRQQYGDEFANIEALEFGDKFVRTARDERSMDGLLDQLRDFSPAQREAALLSIRDDLASRAGNVREGQAPRMNEVVKEPVLQALRRLGPEGQQVADDLLAIDGRLQGNRRIDPRAGSPTANKQQAERYARSNTRGPIRNALGDIFNRATTDTAISAVAGAPTPVGLARGGGAALGRMFNSGANQQVDRVTDLLMSPTGQQQATASRPQSNLPGRPANALNQGPQDANARAQNVLTQGSQLPEQVPSAPRASGLALNGPAGDIVAGGAAGSLVPAEDNQTRLRNMAIGAGGGSALRAGVRSARAQGYAGRHRGEAKEWLEAAEAGLDMATEARMLRAQQLGFDIETPLYHGTNASFESFSKRKRGGVTGAASAKLGTWMTSSPKTAEGYAEYANMGRQYEALEESLNKLYELPDNPINRMRVARAQRQLDDFSDQTYGADDYSYGSEHIMPLLVRGRIKELDMSGAYYGGDTELASLVANAKKEGYDGLKLQNFGDEADASGRVSDHVVVFDPSNIKSTNAAFSTANSGSRSTLMSGFMLPGPMGDAVAGGAAGSLLPAEDGKQRAENALLGAVGIGAGSAAVRSGGAAGTRSAQRRLERGSRLPSEAPRASGLAITGPPADAITGSLAGGLLPAEDSHERLRNMAIGAGAGLGGGQIIRRAAAPRPVPAPPVDMDNLHTLGGPDAPMTLNQPATARQLSDDFYADSQRLIDDVDVPKSDTPPDALNDSTAAAKMRDLTTRADGRPMPTAIRGHNPFRSALFGGVAGYSYPEEDPRKKVRNALIGAGALTGLKHGLSRSRTTNLASTYRDIQRSPIDRLKQEVESYAASGGGNSAAPQRISWDDLDRIPEARAAYDEALLQSHNVRERYLWEATDLSPEEMASANALHEKLTEMMLYDRGFQIVE